MVKVLVQVIATIGLGVAVYTLYTQQNIQDLVIPTVEFFQTIEATYIMCYVILAVALLKFIGIGFKKNKLQKNINLFKSVLEQHVNHNLSKNDKELAFFQNFNEISGQIKENKIFVHEWQEFQESLVLPEPYSENPKIKNSHSASYFFNEESIIAPNYSSTIYTAWSNYFTGFGVLGTFIGLAAGIYGVDFETSDLTISLQKLLGGASVAFLTSICGLICSIVFSMGEKAVYSSLLNNLHKAVTFLDSCVYRITSEDINRKQLDILELLVQQQQDGIDKFTDFAEILGMNLSNAFNTAIAENMAPSLAEISQGITALRDERATESAEFLKEALASFTEQLHGSAGKEIEALGGSLNELNHTLLPLLNEYKETFSQSVTFSKEISLLLSKFTDFHKTFYDNMENFQDNLSNSLVSLSQTNASLMNSTEQVQLTLKESTILFEKTCDEGKKQADIYENYNQKLKEQYEEVNKAWTLFLETNKEQNLENSVVWREYTERFKDIDKSLKEAFIHLTEGLEAYGMKSVEFMKAVDKEMSHATSNLHSTLEEMRETLEEWTEAIEGKKEVEILQLAIE